MRKFTVVLLRDHGSEMFVALVPELPGCATQGLGVDEALEQSREAIAGHLESLAAAGDEIPEEPAEVVVATVEVEDVPAATATGAAEC
jgi:predicted RNase H-like HicB family nuclease